MDPLSLACTLIYRHAYGITANRLEVGQFAPDSLRREPERVARILVGQVLRDIGPAELGEELQEAIAAGIADALDGLPPSR